MYNKSLKLNLTCEVVSLSISFSPFSLMVGLISVLKITLLILLQTCRKQYPNAYTLGLNFRILSNCIYTLNNILRNTVMLCSYYIPLKAIPQFSLQNLYHAKSLCIFCNIDKLLHVSDP